MRSSALIGRLTADLLTRAGAIVDPGPGQTLDVMAEPALGGVLGLREFERLSFEPGVAGATFIDYDASLVDRLAAVVQGLGRVARVQPPTIARKPIDAAAAIARGVTIHNGVHRYHSHAAVDATYVGVTFEYTALADERMGGLVTTWVNPATRSTASFASRIDPTSLLDDPDATTASEWTDETASAWPLALASARASIAPGMADFLERLRRRRERDVRRLREYYEEIDLEIRRKLSRPRLDNDLRRRERDRLDATHRAFHARGAEVADRYRVRLCLSPIAVWLCRLPAYHINVRLMRRNGVTDTSCRGIPSMGASSRARATVVWHQPLPRGCAMTPCTICATAAWPPVVSAGGASAVRARARVRDRMRENSRPAAAVRAVAGPRPTSVQQIVP
jgi:hypothetical protein